MRHPGFFEISGPFSLRQIIEATQTTLAAKSDTARLVKGIRPLREAGRDDLSFLNNRRYAGQLNETEASVCILSQADAKNVPRHVTALIAPKPYDAFARAMQLFYSDAMRSKTAQENHRHSDQLIHATAVIEEGATVEPGAIVGREAVVGRGTTISAGAVVGYRVVIGDCCFIGAAAAVTHALIGSNVIIHAGARIGQDGFGFALGMSHHLKIPQVGCVRIGDDVEIGANTTIDRGTLSDTVIGSGTKIDNLVQIAHNVEVGRNCVIVAQSGVAGSSKLGDFVVMGARAGVLGHVNVGSHAQIASMSIVKDDVEPGARMGGTPARPFKQWARELALIKSLGRRAKSRDIE